MSVKKVKVNKKKLIFGVFILFSFILITTCLAKPDLRIEGILLKENGGSSVIVNGQVMGVGDTIEGVEIVEITEETVKFKDKNAYFIEKIGEFKNREDKEITLNQDKTQKNHFENRMEDINLYYMRRADKYIQQGEFYYMEAITLASGQKCGEARKAYNLFLTNYAMALKEVEVVGNLFVKGINKINEDILEEKEIYFRAVIKLNCRR